MGRKIIDSRAGIFLFHNSFGVKLESKRKKFFPLILKDSSDTLLIQNCEVETKSVTPSAHYTNPETH